MWCLTFWFIQFVSFLMENVLKHLTLFFFSLVWQFSVYRRWFCISLYFMFINCSRSSTREISNLQKSSTAIASENQDGVRNFNSINEGNVSVFFFLKKQRAVVSFFHICLSIFYLFSLEFNVCIVYNVITA